MEELEKREDVGAKIKIREAIRLVPDWPREGINFLDITTALKDKDIYRVTMDSLTGLCGDKKIDKIVGIDARGFIFAAVLADRLGVGMVPARKKGKLPGEIVSQSYGLEYGEDEIEIHTDAISPGETILIVDDVLATGGTVAAAVELVKRLGGNIVGILFFIEIEGLNGREKLGDMKVESLIKG